MKFQEMNNEIIKAMKDKEKERLGALKVFKSEVLKEVKDKGAKENSVTVEKIAIVLHKQMSKALKIVEDKKNRELLSVCEEFMPRMATEKDVKLFLGKICWSEGVKMSEFGKMMGKLKSEFGSTLNGGMASKVLKEFITSF